MVSHFKNKLIAYIELARLDKLAGFLLLMWPCFWAIILAGGPSATNYLLYNFFLFLTGSVAMRGAGCVVNDIIDRDIDAKVERTKTRPLPSGRVNIKEAFVLLAVLTSAGLLVFVQINNTAKVYSLGAFALALIYPLMKRFFSYPQLFLGIVFSSGAIVAWASVENSVTYPAFLLYLGCIFWTVGYDTIYGFQDIRHDLKANIRSTAISFGRHAKLLIIACFLLFFALLSKVVIMKGHEYFYIIPGFIHMIYITAKTNLNSPSDCMRSFKQIAFISGLLIFIGLYCSIPNVNEIK